MINSTTRRIAAATAATLGTAALLVPSAALASKDSSRHDSRSKDKVTRDARSIDRHSIDAARADR